MGFATVEFKYDYSDDWTTCIETDFRDAQSADVDLCKSLRSRKGFEKLEVSRIKVFSNHQAPQLVGIQATYRLTLENGIVLEKDGDKHYFQKGVFYYEPDENEKSTIQIERSERGGAKICSAMGTMVDVNPNCGISSVRC